MTIRGRVGATLGVVVCVSTLGATAQAATYVVNSTNDATDGKCDTAHCSLREAINHANSHAGADIITFNIGGGGHQVIAPTKELPTVTDPVVIDGSSQPGYAKAPLVELDGSGAGAATGLIIAGGSSTVKALVIGNFQGLGLMLNPPGKNNVVVGCYIGTDHTGTLSHANRLTGLAIQTDGNRIGGPKAVDRNVISGNGPPTEITPQQQDSAKMNVFINKGGAAGPDVRDNVIVNNYIGPDVTGKKAVIGTRATGVYIHGGWNNRIGNLEGETGNVISGNSVYGINGTLAGNLFIIGNYIGTDVSGVAPLPNGASGVDISVSKGVVVGMKNRQRNVIAHNGGSGLVFAEFADIGRFLFNSIHDNAGLGIDIGSNDAVTPNDPGDSDGGANLKQNFPVIKGASKTEVKGELDSDPRLTYRIQLFASHACDASGHGEGEVFVAEVLDKAPGPFKVPWLPPFTGPLFLTATATSSSERTSEFSRCFEYKP